MSELYPASAIKFLSFLQPLGAWHLTALGTSHHASASASFLPAQTDELTAWLQEQHAKGWDIYFRVAISRHCSGKDGAMLDEDVTAFSCLWMDIDVPAIKKLTQMNERQAKKNHALQQVKHKLGQLQPTIINDSGNGFHLFWKLRNTVAIGPGFSLQDLSASLYGIAKMFGGDTKCKNPSRLLRLPGTYNTKIASLPLLCHTVDENENEYTLSNFESLRDDTFLSKTPTAISEINPAAMVDLADLDLPDELHAKIETGIDPKTKMPWSDRSQLMNHIAVELVKLGIDPSVILSIIMDSRYHHAGHVIECREPLREARRTLNWALNRGADDSTSRLNRNYFMVCVGGQQIFGWDDEGQPVAIPPREIINVEAFKREIAPIKEFYTTTDKKTGEVVSHEINVFKKWIEDESRRRFYPKGFTIDPTRSHEDGFYNLWKGFAVRSQPGDWGLMRENIRCLCEGSIAYADYVLNWCALLVQRPTIVPRTALVFHGDQGTGKTLFASTLSKFFGPHAYKIDKPQQLVGRFSGHLDSKIFIHAEECQFDHDGLGILKSLVTDEMVSIERKGAQPYQARNYAHVLITTNNEHVLPIEQGNRRFVIFQPLRTHKGDAAFWTALVNQMQAGGYEGMLHDLLKRDITGWNPEATKPETGSMQQHKKDTVSAAKLVARLWLESGDYTRLNLTQLEERYKSNPRELDTVLREVGVIITNSSVAMQPLEIVGIKWLKAMGFELKI